jgi:DNA-directed RNA polymerase subunit E'/Rpb7
MRLRDIENVCPIHTKGLAESLLPLSFILTHPTQDTVAVHPSNFGIPPEQAIISEINKKYANRILHDVGLCVCVFDISEAGEGKVRYGDGFLWYKGQSIFI